MPSAARRDRCALWPRPTTYLIRRKSLPVEREHTNAHARARSDDPNELNHTRHKQRRECNTSTRARNKASYTRRWTASRRYASLNSARRLRDDAVTIGDADWTRARAGARRVVWSRRRPAALAFARRHRKNACASLWSVRRRVAMRRRRRRWRRLVRRLAVVKRTKLERRRGGSGWARRRRRGVEQVFTFSAGDKTYERRCRVADTPRRGRTTTITYRRAHRN